MLVRLLPLIGNTSGFSYLEPRTGGVGHGFHREQSVISDKDMRMQNAELNS